MTQESPKKTVVPVSIIFIALLVILGLADAFLLENARFFPRESEQAQGSSASSAMSVSSIGVRKASGPNVRKILTSQGFSIQETDERTLIGQIISPDDATVRALVLLKDDDRAGLIAWVDSPSINRYFLALKEALHASFSPDVKDLIDEVQEREGKPTRNLLSFFDPGLSEERIVFIRIRERLYELHIVEGQDQAMFDLVEELTQ